MNQAQLDRLRERDELIYHLPLAGEDDWWMSTEMLADMTERTKGSVHYAMVKYRNKGIVEQQREESPKRPGRTRYVLDHEGARWRLRPAQREQEQQEVGVAEAARTMEQAQTPLTRNEHQVLDITLNPHIHWVFALGSQHLQEDDVKTAFRSIRRRLGREV